MEAAAEEGKSKLKQILDLLHALHGRFPENVHFLLVE